MRGQRFGNRQGREPGLNLGDHLVVIIVRVDLTRGVVPRKVMHVELGFEQALPVHQLLHHGQFEGQMLKHQLLTHGLRQLPLI